MLQLKTAYQQLPMDCLIDVFYLSVLSMEGVPW